MSRASCPVAPTGWMNVGDLNQSAPDGEVVPPGGTHQLLGLTIREHFAAMAMQGMLAHGNDRPHEICEASVLMADALIAELAKAQP